MASDKILSVLIPAIPERIESTKKLIKFLDFFTVYGYKFEILMLCDNMQMTIGEKRNKLLTAATGKYIMFCDDDDYITPKFLEVLKACSTENVDVITFLQDATVDGHHTVVDFDLNHTENEIFVTDGVTKRKPFHVCAWKREKVKGIKFPLKNWGEDWEWCLKALKKVKSQYKINEVVHIYTHDKEVSRAYAN